MEATEDEWPGRVIEMWTERSRGPSQKKKSRGRDKNESRGEEGERRTQAATA
jgi:hypothetical protein